MYRHININRSYIFITCLLCVMLLLLQSNCISADKQSVTSLTSKLTELKQSANDLYNNIKNTIQHNDNGNRSPDILLSEAEQLFNQAHDTLHQYTHMKHDDENTIQRVYHALIDKYHILLDKLKQRREHNKQEYIESYHNIKEKIHDAGEAIHHYVDEIAPDTHTHDNSDKQQGITITADDSIISTMKRHAEKLAQKAKNTIHIGGSGNDNINSISNHVKVLQDKLHNMKDLSLQDKISAATNITKLQSSLENLINKGNIHTSQVHLFDSTKQAIIELQNKLKNNNEYQIYSEKLKDTTIRINDNIKHTTENIKHKAHDIETNIQYQAQHIKDDIVDKVGHAKQDLSNIADRLKDVEHEYAQQAKHTYDNTKDQIHHVTDNIKHRVQDARDKVEQYADDTKHKLDSVVDQLKTAYDKPHYGAGTSDEIIDRTQPSVFESLLSGVIEGVGSAYNDAKQQAQFLKQEQQHLQLKYQQQHSNIHTSSSSIQQQTTDSNNEQLSNIVNNIKDTVSSWYNTLSHKVSSYTNTASDQGSKRWQQVKHQYTDSASNDAQSNTDNQQDNTDQSQHHTTTTNRHTISLTDHLQNSLSSITKHIHNILHGDKTSSSDSISSGSGNTQQQDSTVNRVASYYISLYNNVKQSIFNHQPNQPHYGAGTQHKISDRQGKSVLESLLNSVGLREPQDNFQ